MLIVDTYAGLANRMRVILSAVSMARACGHKLKIIWPLDSDLNCSYHDLFFPSDEFEVEISSLSAWFLSKYYSKYYFYRKISELYAGLFLFNYRLYDCEFYDRVWKPPLYLLNRSNIPLKFNNAYIRTCNEFFFNSVEYGNVFRPVQNITSSVAKNMFNFNPSTIGIHIRRTDHYEAIEKTPIEKFIRKMDEELAINEYTNFYLATDDFVVKEKIVFYFGKEKIIINDGDLNRKSKAGMLIAAVDLYCLSNCYKIYGSYRSSFSYVAAKINNSNLIIPSDI